MGLNSERQFEPDDISIVRKSRLYIIFQEELPEFEPDDISIVQESRLYIIFQEELP